MGSSTEKSSKKSITRYGSRLVNETRMAFLHALQQHAPGVLTDLLESVLPIYKRWQAEVEHDALAAADDADKRWLEGVPPKGWKRAQEYLEAKRRKLQERRESQARNAALIEPWPPELTAAVEAWARRNHLLDGGGELPEWVKENAASTLHTWAVTKWKNGEPPLVWSLCGGHEREPDHGQMPPKHAIEWASKLVCGGATVRDIVNACPAKAGISEGLVRKDAKRVLGMIGLGWRENKPGRPRKP